MEQVIEGTAFQAKAFEREVERLAGQGYKRVQAMILDKAIARGQDCLKCGHGGLWAAAFERAARSRYDALAHVVIAHCPECGWAQEM